MIFHATRSRPFIWVSRRRVVSFLPSLHVFLTPHRCFFISFFFPRSPLHAPTRPLTGHQSKSPLNYHPPPLQYISNPSLHHTYTCIHTPTLTLTSPRRRVPVSPLRFAQLSFPSSVLAGGFNTRNLRGVVGGVQGKIHPKTCPR